MSRFGSPRYKIRDNGRMKICHINLAKDYRGGERQTELLLRELSRRGWQQRLIGRHGSKLLARCNDVADVEIVETSSNFLAAGRATSSSALTHAHEARSVYVSLYGAWFKKIPFVITRRVIRPQKPSWFRDRAYDAAGAVATVSAAVAAQISDAYPKLEPVVVPDAHSNLPVDAEFSIGLREKYAGKLLIIHIGTYHHSHKGQLTIIEAAHRAASERPDWHFLLLGDGRDKSRFEAQIGGLTNIELTGFVDNVGDYLSAGDVFVFPSLHEGSVIATRRSSPPCVSSSASCGSPPSFMMKAIHSSSGDQRG